MNKILGYFNTDWSAMTGTDWAGLVVTVIITILMAILYIYVLNPKNRDKLEAHRFIVMDNYRDGDYKEGKNV